MRKNKEKLELSLDIETILDDSKLINIKAGAEITKSKLFCGKTKDTAGDTTDVSIPTPKSICGQCKEQSAPKSVRGGGGAPCMLVIPNNNLVKVAVKSRNCFIN